MFKKLKERIELRNTKRSLEIVLIDKMTTLLEVETERQKAEKEMYEKITAMYSDVNVSDMKNTFEKLSDVLNSNSTKKEFVSAVVNSIKK